MRVSKRQIEAEKAKAQLALAIQEKADELKLTDVEFLQVLHDIAQSRLKFMLRMERHGNYEKPAGLE